MSTELSKALASRFVEEVFNRGNVDFIDEVVVPDFLEHEELPAGIPKGREGVRHLATMQRSAFPDFLAVIEDVIAEGDKVVMRMTWSGTHQGEFMGMPATGKRVSFGVFDIIRMTGGQIVEHWGQLDTMGMMQQLGAIPAPDQGN